MFDNRVMRRIFGYKEDKITGEKKGLHEQFHNILADHQTKL
jgi:hypothetical protein